MRYAIVENGTVVNIAMSESALSDNWIQSDSAGIGYTYSGGMFVPPAAPVEPPAAPKQYEWYIDIGQFFDRFGASKMAILMSTNATVQAIVSDVQVRKWIDLKRADVSAAIDVLIALGVPGVTTTLKSSVLSTPVTAEENLALRKLYF